MVKAMRKVASKKVRQRRGRNPQTEAAQLLDTTVSKPRGGGRGIAAFKPPVAQRAGVGLARVIAYSLKRMRRSSAVALQLKMETPPRRLRKAVSSPRLSIFKHRLIKRCRYCDCRVTRKLYPLHKRTFLHRANQQRYRAPNLFASSFWACACYFTQTNI